MTAFQAGPRNTGATVVLQNASYTTPSGVSTSAAYTGTATTVAVLPAGSIIHAIITDTTTAFVGSTTATLTFQTGNATTGLTSNFASGTSLGVAGSSTSVAVGRATLTPSTTNLALFNNVGTTDLIVQVVFATTGNYTSGGSVNIQVVYAVRNSDGASAPASA